MAQEGGFMRVLILVLCFVLVSCTDGPSKEPQAPVDFQVLSKGEVVDLMPHVKPGIITVFDFYADWCPPCKKLDKSLVSLKQTYGERVEIYKLDVVSWESDLVKHHGIKDLPYLTVYDAQQKMLKTGPSNQVLPVLIAALNQ